MSETDWKALDNEALSEFMHEFYKTIPDPPRPLVKRYGANFASRPDITEIMKADNAVKSERARKQKQYKSMVEESNRRVNQRFFI